MANSGRDLIWDAIDTASDRLSRKYRRPVRASRRRRGLGATQHGFEVPSLAAFVAVREKRSLSRLVVTQRVDRAASLVGALLRQAGPAD